jgi:hypothetical protein
MRNLFYVLFLLACAACSRFDEPIQPIQVPETEAETDETDPETRAGGNGVFEKMANPYRLEVMQAVYDSLAPLTSVTRLQPNWWYFRVLPQNEEQLTWLTQESGLELFDYPLDIQLEEGQEYTDPTIPEGEIGWLYTSTDRKPAGIFPTDYVYEHLAAIELM